MMIGLYLFLNLAVLSIVARASFANGWSLVLMLFGFGFVVGSANNLLEAAVFGVLAPRQLLAAGGPAAIIFAILSPLAVLLAARWRSADRATPKMGQVTAVSLVEVIVVYEVLYWTAGTLVYPYIADFYATKTIPPVYAVAALQVVRSMIFFAAAYPLLKAGLRRAPFVLALVYGIIGGLAPLLPDNPFMPSDIRFYHAIETTCSNFLFGLVVGYLFMRRPPAVAAQA